MSAESKYAIIANWLKTCPAMSGVFEFEAGRMRESSSQFSTNGTDTASNVTYIDGSVKRYFDFSISWYQQVSMVPYRVASGDTNANVARMIDMDALIEWIDNQRRAHTLPSFPSCTTDSIYCKTNEPVLQWIDQQNHNPPLAKYAVAIRCEYIDYRDAI